MVGMLGSGHGRAGPGGRKRHCGRNGSDSDGGTAAGRRPAHGRIVARRDYHCKGTSGAPDGAALGHGSGPARPAARELARALKKERARGQSVEVHYSRRASQTGVRAGTKTGPRAGAELDGQSHIAPQARGDSDRAQRGRIASRARSPDSTGTRRTGEHGGAGTRDGPPPGIGSGARGNPRMDRRLDSGGRRTQELAQRPGPTWGPASPARQGQEFSQSSQWGTAPGRSRPENDGFTSSRSLTPFWSK